MSIQKFLQYHSIKNTSDKKQIEEMLSWEEEFFSYPPKVFRETQNVKFCDISIEGSSSQDLVIHRGDATSPPSDAIGAKQFYVHFHQIDYNRVLKGGRTFEVINFNWVNPYHIVHMEEGDSALKIPTGTFHRSTSPLGGSIVINQAVRLPGFDFDKEFNPVSAADNKKLREVLETVTPIVHGNPSWMY